MTEDDIIVCSGLVRQLPSTRTTAKPDIPPICTSGDGRYDVGRMKLKAHSTHDALRLD